MPDPRKTQRGTSAALGVILLFLVCFAFGIVYFGFVTTNIQLATSTFNTQMVALLLKSFSFNATHIVAYLQNAGNKMVEITNAYVNGLITNLADIVHIVPNAVGAAVLQGAFAAGATYSMKLASIFNTEITFQASF